ncbi:PhoP regulatory network protein YrbL [Enterobacter hormaechei]|nr:PhoP regulatory network protein YrbL [Enterobacter hormaechei]
MIYLSDQTPLGTGQHRHCYAHPGHSRRCIKVIYNSDDSGLKEIKREISYYAHLAHYLKDWSGIPRYYGTLQTDLGIGYVYDLINDYDGKPSVTLQKILARELTVRDVEMLRDALKKLRLYLKENHIITMTLKPQNILCKQINGSEMLLIVCDNIGESTFIPLARWSSWLCHRKQERLWERFIQHYLLMLHSG